MQQREWLYPLSDLRSFLMISRWSFAYSSAVAPAFDSRGGDIVFYASKYLEGALCLAHAKAASEWHRRFFSM